MFFKVRLDLAEPLKRQLAGVFREPGRLLHTRKVRQIMLTDLRHLILKVTENRAFLTVPFGEEKTNMVNRECGSEDVHSFLFRSQGS